MNWKLYVTAFASFLLAAFPQNIFGCGPEEDPHDYFTSFFNRDALEQKGYQPFYYTALLDFYDDWMSDETKSYEDDRVLQEWKKYCGPNTDLKSTKEFIYGYKKPIVDQLLNFLSSNKPLTLPDSVRNNGLTKFFLAQKNIAALRYLSFAKDVERFTWSEDWENPIKRDSLALNKYITQADKLLSEETNSFLKDKYAFQRCKLAFYNNRFQDCIRWYDAYFTQSNTSAVQPLAQSYKAGSHFRLRKNKEAAYEFSKVFAISDHKKQPFLGFLWATDNCNKDKQTEYAALAKNNEEKATIVGMFGLYGTAYGLNTLKQVYSLYPSSPLLPLLTIREINKIEEQYLSPMLAKEKGGKAFYYSWVEEDSVKAKPQLTATIQLFETLAKDKSTNTGLYAIGAAYLSYINRDYNHAKTLLEQAKTLPLTAKLKDQLQLINLLILANEKPVLDAEREKQILPSVEWLIQKAKEENAYAVFLRNFFSEIVAQKYEQQNDGYRAALAYGLADEHFLLKGSEDFHAGNGLEFIRNEVSTEQLLKLYSLYVKPDKTPYEAFLLKHTSFKQNNVIDVLGTSYLRDFNFEKAVEWLQKSTKPELLIATNYNYKTDKETTVNVDPFYDYLNDWQRYSKSLPKPYNKLTLAQKLLQLQKSMDTARDEEAKSKLYYQYASALYNMSYYGNCWNAVAYYRSGSDWNEGNYDVAWKKEYYSVYKAKDGYQKAYELTRNKEFKAACYFMVAKCLQRQIPMPGYSYKDYGQYEKDMKVFDKKFKNNPMFEGFVKQYGTTKFYSYTYNRCSYLQDFVKTTKTK